MAGRSSAARRKSAPAPRGRVPALVATILGAASLCSPTFGDPLYYYRDDGRLVISNTPSRADARPLTRARPAKPAPRTGNLPPSRFDPMIVAAAAEAGVSAPLVKAVALVESALDPAAVSGKGALGLMQLMPATAQQYRVEDPFDPWENLLGGARHLRTLLDEFGGNLPLALAAYNAGSTAVRRSGGVPNYPETRDYLRKVLGRLGQDRGPLPQRTAPRARSADDVRVVRQADGSLLLQN